MYAIVSDLHFHKWSAFASVNADGVNTRLEIILQQILTPVRDLKSYNGKQLFVAGDIFHVRGSIAPSVLNPVIELFKELRKMGIEVYAIPGNHDLESDESQGLTNAAEALVEVGVVMASNKPMTVATECGRRVTMIPWMPKLDDLKAKITGEAKRVGGGDLIIHAPVDGVLPGLPDHGLTPEWLSKCGFDRVFAGHYHNHVDFGNGVYSIGALTHQTWSDVGSLAGYLLVDGDVIHQESCAPKFVQVEPEMSDEDIKSLVSGNYARVTMEVTKESDVAEMREHLSDLGALGVVVQPVKKSAVVARTGSTVKTGATLQASVNQFITAGKFSREKDLSVLCDNILAEAESAS